MSTTIWERVQSTPLIDTHEHLIEESLRLGPPGDRLFPCDDWAYLFLHYLGDDLVVAGMPTADRERFFAPDVPTDEKYRLVAPWWERAKHTGYGQAVRRTLRGLYGEDDLTAQSAPRLAEKYRAFVQPGFYREVFQRAGITHCHVNSLVRIFEETAQPDLLQQDIGIPSLCGVDLARIEREFGLTATSLSAYLDVLETIFARCAPRAVAIKSQCAYWRRLNFDPVEQSVAEPLFAKKLRGEPLAPEDDRALDNFLFRWCVGRATAAGLPVKLHTGYYAGHGRMPLARVKENFADLVPLLEGFPDTTFVLMHIGYPYQDEAIALAKHYKNVVLDLCWAWIINPAAAVRFVREFLLAVPVNKLLPFGGDYYSVESIFGHAEIARQGIAEALSGLVADRWLKEDEALSLLPTLFYGNATERFPGVVSATAY